MEKEQTILEGVTSDADQVSSMETDTLQISNVLGTFEETNMEETVGEELLSEVDKTDEPERVKFIVKDEAGAASDNFIQVSLRSSTRAAKKNVPVKGSEAETQIAAVDEGGNDIALNTSVKSDEGSTQIIGQQELNDAIAAAVGTAVTGEDVEQLDDSIESADKSGTENDATTLSDVQEEDAMWKQNNCIICNVDLDENEQEEKKNMSQDTKMKLKKFFCEYLGVLETVDMEDENFVPFCASCSGDIDKLVSLACKIEFMDSQFEKLRDTLARKTVKTYLYRTKPELLAEEAELVPDTTDEPLDPAEPLTYSHPADLLFNHWKRQYDMIIPGRFKKFPVLLKAMDWRQRVSYYRIDNAGKHHFITAVDGNEKEDTEDNQKVKIKKFKRKTSKGDTVSAMLVNKKLRFEESLSGDSQDEEDLEVEQAEVTVEETEKRAYQCIECPRSYATKSLLKYHARIHSGERPFQCTHCTKSFAQRGGLATHLLVHSGEKPFVCEICGKHFRQKYHLTQHKFIHSGVKPFQCEVCEKRFNVKMNLKEHMRRHTGDRPYPCNYCTTIGFFRKKKLRDHMVKLHPHIPLPADLANLASSKVTKKSDRDASLGEDNQESDSENKNEDIDCGLTTDEEMNSETTPIIVRTSSGRTVKSK